MKSLKIVLMLACGLLLGTSFRARAELRAGAAKTDLTPDVKLLRVPLGGYAARKGKPATGVLNPVYARALVVEDNTTKANKTKVAIVSCDLCFLPAGVRLAVAKRLTGTPAADCRLFLAATHTHTGPDPMAMHPGNTFTLNGWTPFNAKLLAFTAAQIATAILDVDKNLQAVRLESAQADLKNRNRNRRGDPTVDPQMTVLRLIATKPDAPFVVATIVNFAAHPTLFDDTDMAISPDYPGVLTSEIEKRTGEKSVCLFLNGAEGDATVSGANGKTAGERVRFYGTTLANDATEIGNRMGPAQHPISLLVFREIEVELPARKPHGTFIVAAATYGATFAQAREIVNALMPTKTTLTLVSLGDVLLMGFPCEPTGDIGLAAKAMAKALGYAHPCVVALVNDWLAYCTTPEQYRAGKYEATMSFYGETFGTTLLQALKGVETRN